MAQPDFGEMQTARGELKSGNRHYSLDLYSLDLSTSVPGGLEANEAGRPNSIVIFSNYIISKLNQATGHLFHDPRIQTAANNIEQF